MPPSAPTAVRTGRLRTAVGAAGALAAQLSQALASFVLQILAARNLGAEGLGRFALLYGGIVVATGLSTGLVGDSLTVLDRGNRRIRAGLEVWLLTAAATAGIVGAVIAAATGVISAQVAVLYAGAMAVFIVEDVLRRTLMAVLRFWSIVIVDLSTLVAAVALLGGLSLAGRTLTLGDFVLALLAGQVVGLIVAVPLLPAVERTLAPLRSPAVGAVWSYGSWRGAQQALRPAALTVVRAIVVATAGAAAFGQLEAARVYMAPALLIVQGAGSYLFATYAMSRDLPLARAARRADVTTVGLLTVSLVLGALAAAVAPTLGDVITAGDYTLDRVAVFGWALYAAASAASLPYGSLAAVRGRQAQVLGVRLFDSLVSIGVVAVLVYAVDADPAAVPYGLAVGPFVGAAVIRLWLLRDTAPPGAAPVEPEAVEPARNPT